MDCPDASGTTPAERPFTAEFGGGAAFKVQLFGVRAAATTADAGSARESGWVGLPSSAHAVRATRPSAGTSWTGHERNMVSPREGSYLPKESYTGLSSESQGEPMLHRPRAGGSR